MNNKELREKINTAYENTVPHRVQKGTMTEQNTEQLKKDLERLELSDPDSKGCSVTLAELLGNKNVDIIYGLFLPHLISSEEIKREAVRELKEMLEANTHMISEVDVSKDFYKGWLSAHKQDMRSVESYLTQSKGDKE